MATTRSMVFGCPAQIRIEYVLGRQESPSAGPMSAENDVLMLIQTAFAGQRPVVERAFREVEEFRSLCEDYYECVTSIERWRNCSSEEAAHREREYSVLLLELDREIQTWLEREALRD